MALYGKFGELDSADRLNELAGNLLKEGDKKSIGILAQENGIPTDYVQMFIAGDIPVLCDIAPAQKEPPTIDNSNVKTDSAIAENSPSATAEEPEQVEIDEILPPPEKPAPLRDLKDRFLAEMNSLKILLDCENFSGMAQTIERLEHLRIKMVLWQH